MHELGWIAGISLLLLILNGIYVAAEFAIISLPKITLEKEAAEGNLLAQRYLAIVSSGMEQDRYIAVAQMGITLASLGLGMYGEHALAEWLSPRLKELGAWSDTVTTSISVGTSLLLLTYFHIVVGEMVPKSLALMHPLTTARALWWPMRVSGFILAPLGWFLNWLGAVCLRMLGLPVSENLSTVYSPDELRLVMEESRDEGLLPANQHEMLERVMDFGERHLRLVMVPRIKIVALPHSALVSDAVTLIRTEGYSRYPIYCGDRDNIISVLHVKDLFGALRRGETERPVSELAHPVEYFPESLLCDEALEKLRAAKAHFAVVVEDRGGTAGIITAEDLIEELFGEIHDEFDDDEVPLVTALEDGWRVFGGMSLVDLEEVVGQPVAGMGDAETVSGLLAELLHKVPEEGDSADHDGFRFQVESVEQRAVAHCRVSRVIEAAEPALEQPE